MDPLTIAWITLAVFCMATMYSTVGHGGGSGYLAVLGIAAIAPEQMKSTALLLNVAVSLLATWKFSQSGSFRKDLFLPLVCVSVPAAFLGGFAEISPTYYTSLVAVILLFAAIRLFIPMQGTEQTKNPAFLVLLLAGTGIGFLGGIIGIGGGILLSPLILLFGWATAKQTAAISAPFILLNSLSGLGGIVMRNGGLPVDSDFVTPLGIAVVVGGYIGASVGSKKTWTPRFAYCTWSCFVHCSRKDVVHNGKRNKQRALECDKIYI